MSGPCSLSQPPPCPAEAWRGGRLIVLPQGQLQASKGWDRPSLNLRSAFQLLLLVWHAKEGQSGALNTSELLGID